MRSYHQVRGKFQAHASGTAWKPTEVASFYEFPGPVAGGPAQGIGLIELGGGFDPSDVAGYFHALGLPAPPVTFVGIDGARNLPDGADGAQGEVTLDIDVAGGVTGGTVPIFVVTAPNTEQGFADAVAWCAGDPRVTVVSISWGAPEDQWTAAGIQLMETAIAKCLAAGKCVCVASGDNGSSDGLTGKHVDYPSASPQAVGCGGTTLQRSGLESVWNNGSFGGATGGGVSTRFATPAWQPAASILGRGRAVPDVAGVADPQTGWLVRVAGQDMVIGGTSAVAPMWAGLVALLQQHLGRHLGNDWVKIYQSQVGFRDIVQGNNGDYAAKVGYDCCTGLGTPRGLKLLGALQTPTVPDPTPTPTPTPSPAPPPVHGSPMTVWQDISDLIRDAFKGDRAAELADLTRLIKDLGLSPAQFKMGTGHRASSVTIVIDALNVWSAYKANAATRLAAAVQQLIKDLGA